MRVKSTIAVAFCAPVLVLGSAVPASAGEVTGPPEDGFATGGPTGIWGHANSICAFSGLNALHPGKEPTQTQSYGTIVKNFRSLNSTHPMGEETPGVQCNGSTMGMTH